MDRYKDIQKITLWGAGVNFLLLVLKFLAGVLGNSQVMIADAVHSLSDFFTDIAVALGAKFWEQPADEEHPYGHARLENLVTLFIGAVLFLVGLKLIGNAVLTLHQMVEKVDYVPATPTFFALGTALASILLKEVLYQATARVGRQIHSTAVVANAWHHRADALSSIPAAVAVGATLFWGSFYAFLDPVGTVLVGGMILVTACRIFYPAFCSLMDSSTSKENRAAILEIVRSCPGVFEPHHLRTRSLGSGLDVDLHIRVDGQMTVSESHRLSHEIEEKLFNSQLDVLDVMLHIEPVRND